jgi:hypothetical protein
VVKSLLGTSTAFEKQMAALEQEQEQEQEQEALEEQGKDAPVIVATPNVKPNAKLKTKAATVKAKPVAEIIAVDLAEKEPVVASTQPEKKKPGRKPKIQLIVKDKDDK